MRHDKISRRSRYRSGFQPFPIVLRRSYAVRAEMSTRNVEIASNEAS